LLLALVDESGITPHGDRTSTHFVLSAVVFDERNRPKAEAMREHLCAFSGSTSQRSSLHFKSIPNHGARRYMTHVVGGRPWLTIASVVVCKRLLAEDEGEIADISAQYNYTFRYLLERLSWIAERRRTRLSYIAASLGTAPPERLAEHEEALRRSTDPTMTIKWDRLTTPAGRMVAMSEEPLLQLADLSASATAKAFEPDEWGFTERAYLRNLSPALFRSSDGERVFRYGLKIHPVRAESRVAYSWASDLPKRHTETVPRRE
jgi:hypothetical protein